jgi:hypothetical protein
MGGHGGLNILPQKSWHVYNRDNRQRVARDEAEHADKEREVAERHAAAEREALAKTLKARARQRHGGAANINLDAPAALPAPENPAGLPILPPPPADDAMAALEAAQPPPAKRQRRQKPPPPPPALARQIEAPAPAPSSKSIAFEAERPQHINLFAAEEAAAAGGNPDREAEQRRDSARRGDPKTHTSDPRFDESFSIAYALRGSAAAPWYAAATRPEGDGAAPTVEKNAEGVEEWRRRGAAALAASATKVETEKQAEGKGEGELRLLQGVVVARDQKGERKGGKKRHRGDISDDSSSGDERRGRRRKEKEKGGSRKKGRRRGKDASPPAADKWAVLREERLQREEAERVRQREAVRAATGRDGPGGRRYNSGFGHGR